MACEVLALVQVGHARVDGRLLRAARPWGIRESAEVPAWAVEQPADLGSNQRAARLERIPGSEGVNDAIKFATIGMRTTAIGPSGQKVRVGSECWIKPATLTVDPECHHCPPARRQLDEEFPGRDHHRHAHVVRATDTAGLWLNQMELSCSINRPRIDLCNLRAEGIELVLQNILPAIEHRLCEKRSRAACFN